MTGIFVAGETIACSECDLLLNLPDFEPGYKACCPRCGHIITEKALDAKNKVMAFAISAVIFLAFSIPFTFLSFESKGNERVISLLDAAMNMMSQDFDSIAVLLLLTTILVPGFFLFGVIFVMSAVNRNHLLPGTKTILKGIFHLLDWNMAEIFLIGILVSFIKIVSMAHVAFGLSFGAYVLFIVCLVATASQLDRFQVWRWVGQLE